MILAFDIALACGLIGLAVHIVMTREGKAAIIAFIAFGLLLGLAWARLSSIDVALTEAAIGGGVTGLLLLRTQARMSGAPAARASVGANIWAIGVCAAVALALGAIVLALPAPAPSLAREAADGLASTGLGNPVTAVLLAFRALDTLLEKVVLVLALIGVWSLAADHDWGGAPSFSGRAAPEPLVFLGRLLPPFGILIAFYQFWVGADAPGGAFQAGTILAAMWLLVMMAGLRAAPRTDGRAVRLALAGGPLVFMAVGGLGFVVAKGFLSYPPGLAKALILAVEAVLALSIAVILALLVGGPPGRERAR